MGRGRTISRPSVAAVSWALVLVLCRSSLHASARPLISAGADQGSHGSRTLLGCDNRADCDAWGPGLCSNAGVKALCPCMCGGGGGGTPTPAPNPSTGGGGTGCNDNRADCTAWGPGLCSNSGVKALCPCMCGGGGGGGGGTITPAPNPSTGGGGTGSGTVYSGDITYYTGPGTTACGNWIDQSGNFAAISSALSAQLNTSPSWPPSWCGRSARVTGPIGSAIVQVVDKCPVCATGSIDVSPDIFRQVVGSLDIGRAKGSFQFV